MATLSQFHTSFLDQNVEWSAQLAKAERLNQVLAGTSEEPIIKEDMEILEKMVDPRPIPPGKDSDVNHLIQQLQEERVQSMSNPGSPMVFMPGADEGSNSAAHEPYQS
jgi:hypothetical protein